MKKILRMIPVLLLLFQQSQGQIYQDIKTWFRWDRARFKDVLRPPLDTPHLAIADTGAIRSDPFNKKSWMWVLERPSMVLKWVETTGGSDNAASYLGIKITRIDDQNIKFEYKGQAFNAITDLRSYAGFVDNTYTFRVSDANGIREYKYDASDVTTADDGVLTDCCKRITQCW
jgi:hypothetical protein